MGKKTFLILIIFLLGIGSYWLFFREYKHEVVSDEFVVVEEEVSVDVKSDVDTSLRKKPVVLH